MLQVNDELLRALVARKDEVNMVPHRVNRYAQDYLDFQMSGVVELHNQPHLNALQLGGWVECGDGDWGPLGVDA